MWLSSYSVQAHVLQKCRDQDVQPELHAPQVQLQQYSGQTPALAQQRNMTCKGLNTADCTHALYE